MYHKFAENNNLVPAQPATKSESVPTNNKKVEVHDATEKTTDVTPKQTETEHEKQVLTGTLAQKAAQVKDLLNKRAADVSYDPEIAKRVRMAPEDTGSTLKYKNPYALKLMPERSRYADEIAVQQGYNDYRDITNSHNMFINPALKNFGGMIGGEPGKAVGQMAGYGLQGAGLLGEYERRKADRTSAMQNDMNAVDYQNKIHAIQKPPAAPVPPPVLPQGQPRPPIAQPPRGLGSAGLNKTPNPTAFGKNIFNKMQ